MRIAWTNEHAIDWNGGIRYILEVTSRLARDNTVDILSTDYSKDNFYRFSAKRVTLLTWNTASAKSIKYWLLYPYYLLKAVMFIKPLKSYYDTFISSSPTSDIWCLLAGIKPIIVCFEINPWLHNKEYIKGLSLLKRIIVTIAKPIIRPLELRAYRNAKAIICHSKFVQSEIRKVYNINSMVVPVGVDTKFFSRVEDSILHNVYKDYTILLHITSYLSPMRGHKYSIEAMKYIIKEVPNAMLLITLTKHNERYETELRRLSISLGVDKYVQFIFNVPESDMPALYSLAKVMLQPALDENAHNPTIEAGCCECPAVGFSGKFESEDIVHGETGVIAHRQDSKNMASCAILILKNNKLRDKLGKHARQFMINKFSWERCLARYQELIR